MNDLQRTGGVAALVGAAAYVSAFALFMLFLDSSASVGPVGKVAFLIENRSALQGAIVVTYIVTGIALVALTAALHDRLKGASPASMQLATPLGFIWAALLLASGMISLVGIDAAADLYGRDPERAASLWLAVATVADGLGGGIEIVGGLWVVIVGLAARHGGGLPRLLAAFGLVVGTAGILTLVPTLDVMAEIFGLGMILWFAALGVVMLRTRQADPTSASAPASARRTS